MKVMRKYLYIGVVAVTVVLLWASVIMLHVATTDGETNAGTFGLCLSFIMIMAFYFMPYPED